MKVECKKTPTPSLGNRKSPKLFSLKFDYMMEYMHVEYHQAEVLVVWIETEIK